MTCFYPLEGWRTPSGGLSFTPRGSFTDIPKVKVGCGQCLGCRADRRLEWSVRIMHEAACHEHNCFITLTYDDKHLPDPPSLTHSHFQVFIQKFRDAIAPKRVSYFMCGEYGTRYQRPHFHAIIFGHDFGGRRRVRGRGIGIPAVLEGDTKSYPSAELALYWERGFNAVGRVTAASAKYVAGYCLKKVTGVVADDYYARVDPRTGEVYWLTPEYARMSTRPAVGKTWFDRYSRDVLSYDGVFMDGKKLSVPRYYDKLREQRDAAGLAAVKLKRRLKAFAHAVDNTPERLSVRAEVARARLKTYTKEKL